MPNRFDPPHVKLRDAAETGDIATVQDLLQNTTKAKNGAADGLLRAFKKNHWNCVKEIAPFAEEWALIEVAERTISRRKPNYLAYLIPHITSQERIFELVSMSWKREQFDCLQILVPFISDEKSIDLYAEKESEHFKEEAIPVIKSFFYRTLMIANHKQIKDCQKVI